MNTKFWSDSLKISDHIEDISVGERIILKRIVKEQGGRV
jgi:hypothetical protein